MSAAAGRSRAFCIRISEKRCHRHQAKTSCELHLYCFSLICLCSYQFSFMVSAVCCLFFVSQLEMSIFKSDGSSKDLTSERMHRWRHTHKGTNTPKASSGVVWTDEPTDLCLSQANIITGIITYQSLMLVTDAQGSSSLIALWFPVLSPPLQTPLCHGFHLQTFCNESFLIHQSGAAIRVNSQSVNITKRAAQLCSTNVQKEMRCTVQLSCNRFNSFPACNSAN